MPMNRLFNAIVIIQITLMISSCANKSVFDLSEYQPQEGIQLTADDSVAEITWIGAHERLLTLEFAIESRQPVFRALRMQIEDGTWIPINHDFKPVFSVVSGVRRVTQQQTEPLVELGVPLTEDLLDSIKWDAFWDAPLYLSQDPPSKRQSSIPAAEPFANHPGLPRKLSEVNRASAQFNVQSCRIITDGARLQIVFDGLKLGIFDGYLQLDIIKNENLLRMMVVAKTNHPSAAFKYDAGLADISTDNNFKIVSRDLHKAWESHSFDVEVDKMHIKKTANRIIAAQFDKSALAFFPPPHSFYWARETEEVLGYNWFRKEHEGAFSMGIRQAELEENPEFHMNYALYSARPGKWQRMPMFIYIHSGDAKSALSEALKFTRMDRYKAIDGYKVMGHHYHVGLVNRLKDQEEGFLVNDISTMKKVGMDIYGVIDGVRDREGRHDRGEAYLRGLKMYYDAARLQSDEHFLVMPCDENSTGGRPPFLGGHYDIIPSKPIYWRPQRKEDEALYDDHPKYGRVYNCGEPDDLLEMARLENALIALPHPHSKGSTGFPYAIQDSAYYQHPNYFGLGYRWGMGIDASEVRLGEYRFLRLWDQTNNYLAKKGLAPKYAIAISEARSDKGTRGKPSTDDVYGMSPVNYLKIDKVPSIDDMSGIVNALKEGDYFISTGEILITGFELKQEGRKAKFVADLEWTFPLEFVELVWGDGDQIGREVFKTTDLPAFSQKRFALPFDAEAKSWVRFAAWDIAGNGALVNPFVLQQ
jgi:hypothetical protein